MAWALSVLYINAYKENEFYFYMDKLGKYNEFKKDWFAIEKIDDIVEKRRKIDLLLNKIRVFFEFNYKTSSLLPKIYSACDLFYIKPLTPGYDNSIKTNNARQNVKHYIITRAILDFREIISLSEEKRINSIEIISNILKNFNKVAKQLVDRHDNRTTLTIQDEYDVQDLLGSLLKINFADVRSEEWTPSNAGKSSRMDKLLKVEGIAIETKMTNAKNKDKEIGDDIKIDYADYKTHQDCKSLVVFIYDPEGLLKNPLGLKNDLEKMSSKEFPMRVFINP